MTIGELAAKAATTAKTIRYYEEIGLLERPSRTDAGYRLYAEHDLARLAFVGKAKRLGLSLDEIRGILAIRGSGAAPCVHVMRLLGEHVERVDRTIEQLTEFGDALRRLRVDAEQRIATSGAGVCGIIEHAEIRIDTSSLAAPLAPRRRTGPPQRT